MINPAGEPVQLLNPLVPFNFVKGDARQRNITLQTR